MNATFDYWTDDAHAIQKIVDGEADAYIGSTGKILRLLRAVKRGPQAAPGADPVRSPASGLVFAHDLDQRRIS